MVHLIYRAIQQKRDEMLSFAQELVRIKSITGSEGGVARAVSRKMRELNYDEVIEDRFGNVLGTVGNGKKKILFDSHMDTVDVVDAENWKHDPFGGEIEDGRLYGRGSVDMKGTLAVTVYVGAIAKELGLLHGKKLYISASAMEEDYDGEMVTRMLQEQEIELDYVIIGEATDLNIGYGHRGRALIEANIYGKATHGSRPEQGINPVYSLRHVIGRVEALADRLTAKAGEKGSVAITRVGCVTASNNSVPQSAYIVLDRRLSIQEDISTLEEEMAEILQGMNGNWKISDIPGTSWKGVPITLHSYLPAWEIPQDNWLVRAAEEACEAVLGRKVDCFKPGYSTNAAATAGVFHIPTIILGPGNVSNAHGTDEFCDVEALLQAGKIYLCLCNSL